MKDLLSHEGNFMMIIAVLGVAAVFAFGVYSGWSFGLQYFSK